MLKELLEKQKLLMVGGIVFFFGFVILAVVSIFDPIEILGINRWIKPMKFFISISVFVWTTAVYLYFLKGYEKSKKLISWMLIAIFSVEMFIIIMQPLRGTTSHFNRSTIYNDVLYTVMGITITFSVIIAAYLLYLYFKADINLPPSIVWGMRFGLILFIVSGFEGGYMASQIGHGVGVADGGAGLPIVNWSTEGGDLRVAHFFGMHAFQVVPFFAYTLEKYQIKNSAKLVFIFAFLYFAAFSVVFVQALLAQPLLPKF